MIGMYFVLGGNTQGHSKKNFISWYWVIININIGEDFLSSNS